MAEPYPTREAIINKEHQIKEVARKEMVGWNNSTRNAGFAALEKMSFHQFTGPNPSDFDAVIAAYKEASAKLESDAKPGVKAAVAAIGGWEGESGTAAKDKLGGLPGIIDEQRGLALVLAELINKEKVLVGEAKHEIIKIGDAAIVCIEDMENCKGGNNKDVKFTINETVRNASLNTGMAVPGGKVKKPDFGSLPGDRTVTIDAADVTSAANSIVGAVNKLTEDMNAIRLKIVECLNANIVATNNDEGGFFIKSGDDNASIEPGSETDFQKEVKNQNDTAKPPPPDVRDKSGRYPWEKGYDDGRTR